MGSRGGCVTNNGGGLDLHKGDGTIRDGTGDKKCIQGQREKGKGESGFCNSAARVTRFVLRARGSPASSLGAVPQQHTRHVLENVMWKSTHFQH